MIQYNDFFQREPQLARERTHNRERMLYRRTEGRGRRACATQHVAQFIRTSCAEAERWGRDPGRVDPNAKREG